ncbi:hypothetical protein COCSADRAFT_280376 [Bipolaris sorokiniana ND90Pr]|uniref:Uncharacterized protein n=1 Tax=Cochliobolus sativus (strain ND90Pr / ATCC 201652) TaxID=665912 RepID=M2SMG0_COCSN|nr:uncharacterized protein COCSADRAFT_280376 [Bipolaris sorokiniana ND90Pr]EMD58331.1 hypothetical protein COCSADRAFT_280376 [Bipolaris sorokiniana ND90Pr]
MRLALQCADGCLALFQFMKIDSCFLFPMLCVSLSCLFRAPLLLLERIHAFMFNYHIVYFDSERSMTWLNDM